MRKTFLVVVVMLLWAGAAFGADLAVPFSGANATPAEWQKIVAAARKEGKLVISGDPSSEWRFPLVDMFQQEYPEIKIEYTGINGRNFWPRVRQERAFGKNLWDLRAGGVESSAYEAKREGLLAPIRSLLLPESADGSKWVGGLDGLFNDRENKYMPTYTIIIRHTAFVNRDFVKESELRSSEQLLDPRFKGKIVMQTPTGGASFSAFGNLGFMYGINFIRELLTKQSVIVTDDKRQQAEWVVRGKYPIAIGFNETQLIPFEKQGLGKNITMLNDKIIPVGTGLGGISLFKDAPHPHAAIVYINWLLSQKTQIKLTKNVQLNSRRTDVPVVLKEVAVDPDHLDRYRFFSTEENDEITTSFLPVIKQALQNK